jgi:3-hydroxybutyryl-CoA dehydrogenase
MGTGVAQVFAQIGCHVVLLDRTEEDLKRARRNVRNNLRLQRMVAADGNRPNPSEVLARIQFSTDPAQVAAVDFLVENIIERWEDKAALWRVLDALAPEHCIFAANTSCISITRLASQTSRADRVLGIHFMNPAPMKSAAEVIKGVHTSDATLETALALLKQAGIDGIVVNDQAGFVSNRVLMLTINEAINTVYEGVADPDSVDAIFTRCFGHAMGPLATGDLIGLDTILQSLEVLQDSFGDPKFRPSPLLRRMVDAGQLGRKSGQGFFEY